MAVLAAAAFAAAAIVQRTRTSASATAIGVLPSHLDRGAFARPDARWLVVVFSADSCLACAEVISWVQGLESGDVAVQVAEVERDAELHKANGIDSVPSTVLVDADGGVHVGLLGPLSETGKTQILDLIA